MSGGLEGPLLVLAVGKLVCCVSSSVVSDSLQPHGLQSSRLLCPWNSPCKDTEMGFMEEIFIQEISLTQGSDPHVLHPLH